MKTSLPEQISYTEHAADVLAEAARLIQAERRFALITSTAIEGGAAREVGSLALVDEDGHMVGYLSNGCIDRDIRHQALDALNAGVFRVVRYGTGSPFMDLKLPCGGALTLTVDPTPQHQAILDATSALAARKPALLTPAASDDENSIVFQYSPKTRVVLAGRGAILRAVAKVADATGFEVIVLSPDLEDLRAMERLEPVHIQHLSTPDAPPDLTFVDEHTAILTLFHDHDWEPQVLLGALDTPAFFLGCLGSRRTHEQRRAKLAELGALDDRVNQIHGPIGLVSSLRNANLIAVSAIAQITSVLPPQIRNVVSDIPDQRFASVANGGSV